MLGLLDVHTVLRKWYDTTFGLQKLKDFKNLFKDKDSHISKDERTLEKMYPKFNTAVEGVFQIDYLTRKYD